MDMLGKVRRTGLSRNTVKKWLKAASDVAPKYQRAEQSTVLTPFVATLVAALKADANPREHTTM